MSTCHETSPGLERADFAEIERKYLQHMNRGVRLPDAAGGKDKQALRDIAGIDERVYDKWDPVTNRSFPLGGGNSQLEFYAKALMASVLETPPLPKDMEEGLGLVGTLRPLSAEEIETGFIALRAALSAMQGVLQADTKGLDKEVLIDAILRPVRKYL